MIWSGCRDSNPGPLDPQSSALPGCATSRFLGNGEPEPEPELLNCELTGPAKAGHYVRYALARFRFSGRAGFLVLPRFEGDADFCRTDDNVRRAGAADGGSSR